MHGHKADTQDFAYAHTQTHPLPHAEPEINSQAPGQLLAMTHVRTISQFMSKQRLQAHAVAIDLLFFRSQRWLDINPRLPHYRPLSFFKPDIFTLNHQRPLKAAARVFYYFYTLAFPSNKSASATNKLIPLLCNTVMEYYSKTQTEDDLKVLSVPCLNIIITLIVIPWCNYC